MSAPVTGITATVALPGITLDCLMTRAQTMMMKRIPPPIIIAIISKLLSGSSLSLVTPLLLKVGISCLLPKVRIRLVLVLVKAEMRKSRF